MFGRVEIDHMEEDMLRRRNVEEHLATGGRFRARACSALALAVIACAAMLVVREDGGVWLNNDVVLRLQVDDHDRPIEELRRLVEIAAEQRERSGG